MRHEPIDFGNQGLAARAAVDRVSRVAKHWMKRAESQSDAGGIGVIDEAFAGFTHADSRATRVDSPCETTAAQRAVAPEGTKGGATWEPTKREIVADLSAQLAALDRQRERLAKLLRSIDILSLDR